MNDASAPTALRATMQSCGIERCMTCLSPLTFDRVPIAIAHVSLAGNLLRANKAFADLVGAPERDLVNARAQGLFAPEVTADEARALRAVVKGDAFETELRKTLVRADGTRLPVALRYAALRDLSGWAHCGMILIDPPTPAGAREDLDRISKVLSAETAEGFFRSLLIELTAALGTDFAFIGELVDGPVLMGRSIAACDRGQIIQNFEYAIAGTPCSALLDYGICSFSDGVGRMFPASSLQALEIEGYVGVRLQNSRQKPFGMIVALHREPMRNADRILAMLRDFAPRVSAELERIQVEQELRRSERYLSEAQRIAHLGNWVFDPDEDRLLGSEEAYRICGLGGPPRAMSSRDFFRVIHPEDREDVRAALARSMSEGAALDIAFRIVAGGEAVRTVELRGELAFPPSLSGKRMCGTLQDVTDRESATEELRKLSMAIEQAADQIVITDSLGNIEYVNRAFEKLTGYARQEAVGANPRILKSGLQAPAFYRDLWDTLTRGEVFRGVFINRKKNGEIYYEEKTVTPIRNPKGEIAKYVATGTDITDRRLAEEEQSRLHDALRAAAAEWRVTFDAMLSAIVVLDADGVIRRLNHAASSLLRARPMDVVGHPLERVAVHEPWITARALLDAIGERKTLPAVEIRAEGVTWDVTLTTVGAPGGNQVILVIRDVTRTVALQESLRRSERMSAMGALVAGVAHEARNPLFGISATLDAFEKSLRSGSSDPERYMGVLRRELGRLNQLMHELLEYGRPLDLDLADHELDALVGKALEACELMASQRGVLLESSVGRGVRLWCDGPKVEQAVRNLVENAIQHSAAGQVVAVKGIADAKAKLAGCEVLDEGSGFDPADLPQVFEPFFSRRRGGTGLGLAIVQRVIEQHEGRVAASNRSGGGACVSILLPLAEERP